MAPAAAKNYLIRIVLCITARVDEGVLHTPWLSDAAVAISVISKNFLMRIVVCILRITIKWEMKIEQSRP